MLCSPLKKPKHIYRKKNMGFISELDLADFEDNESTHESHVA